MTWDGAFSDRYDRWAADTTGVDLALVEGDVVLDAPPALVQGSFRAWHPPNVFVLRRSP